MKTLVLGIGNLLLCDEGVGVHLVRALRREPLPSHVTALEVGTAFLYALPEIEQADRIIIVDAMHAGEGPGTVYRVPFDECARPEVLASLHGFDLSRVMFMAGRNSAPEVVVIGVEPALIDWGTEPSSAIQEVFGDIVEILKAEIGLENRAEAPAGPCRGFSA